MSDIEQTIDYDALTKEALRGVAKKVLRDVEKHGLPGEHHLFISFNTRADGVIISKRLREEYPDEMTVVLQHRFWDLEVHEDRFQVKLTFNAIPERLTVPFAALKVFFDPSVPFGLQFAASDMTVESIRRSPVISEITTHTENSGFPVNPEDYPNPSLEFLTGQMSDLSSTQETDRLDEKTDPAAAKLVDDKPAGEVEADAEVEAGAKAKTETAEIVELDSFRKN